MTAQSNVTPISDRTLLPRSLIKRPKAPVGVEQEWMIAGWKSLVSQMHFLEEAGAPREEELRVIDAMDGLRAVYASTRPTRPEVAILQLCMAVSELDAFDCEWISDPEGDQIISVIKSLVANALLGMEDSAGISRTTLGGDYLAGHSTAAN